MTIVNALQILLIPIMAWLDKQRGHSKENETITKAAALVGLGLSIAILLGAYNASVITIIAVTWTAYGYGFGEPLGRIVSGGATNGLYETWQIGPLRERPYLAMTVRGLLILPTALVANWIVAIVTILYAPLGTLMISAVDVAKLTIAFGIAFPLAPLIAVRLGKRGDPAWALQEYLRGALIAAILLVGKLA